MFGQKEPAGQGVQTYKHKAKSTFSHLLQRNRNPFRDVSMTWLTIREWCGLKTSIPCNIDFFLSNLLHNSRTIPPPPWYAGYQHFFTLHLFIRLAFFSIKPSHRTFRLVPIAFCRPWTKQWQLIHTSSYSKFLIYRIPFFAILVRACNILLSKLKDSI